MIKDLKGPKGRKERQFAIEKHLHDVCSPKLAVSIDLKAQDLSSYELLSSDESQGEI